MAAQQDTPPVPREPGAYRPHMHFPERFHDRYEDDRPPRHLDDEIVRECIKHGDLRRPSTSIALFRREFGGITYRLVANTDDREVITGYPLEIDGDVARESGRWSPEQIEDIREFIETKSLGEVHADVEDD